MKLKYKFVINELGDSFVAVPIDDYNSEFNGVLKFDKNSVFVIEKLNDEISYEALIQSVSDNFSLTNDEAKNAVEDLLAELRNNSLLEE